MRGGRAAGGTSIFCRFGGKRGVELPGGGGRSGTEQEGVAGSNSGERGPAFGRRGWRSLLPESGAFGGIGVFERGLVLMGEAEGLLGEERGF